MSEGTIKIEIEKSELINDLQSVFQKKAVDHLFQEIERLENELTAAKSGQGNWEGQVKALIDANTALGDEKEALAKEFEDYKKQTEGDLKQTRSQILGSVFSDDCISVFYDERSDVAKGKDEVTMLFLLNSIVNCSGDISQELFRTLDKLVFQSYSDDEKKLAAVREKIEKFIGSQASLNFKVEWPQKGVKYDNKKHFVKDSNKGGDLVSVAKNACVFASDGSIIKQAEVVLSK